MKVVSYLKTVPAKNSNNQKTDLLLKFVKGANTAGDVGSVNNTDKIEHSEVAVIQGWVHKDISSPHLKLRNDIIHHQVSNGRYVVAADANLFLYNDKTNPHGYLRYSFNGIFPNTGIYCDREIDPARWQQISRDTGIQLEDNKTHGSNILIMLQRNGGWSMTGRDVQDWALDTINKIRFNSDRPIVIRAHPGDKNAIKYLNPKNTRIKNLRNVTISSFDKPLEADLNNAWCVVNHNSSAVVGPIIKGYHCFITDPQKSQCQEVSNTDFKYIESPRTFDRQHWLERISMFHWNFDELENGSCWRHMRNYCQ